MSKITIVGITGRSGSGKSSVTRHYAAKGYPVADGDEISRAVMEKSSPCVQELAGEFGAEILAADGSLLRKRLGELAFESPQRNEALLRITHPHIMQEFLRRVELAQRQGAKLFFLDGAMIVGGMFQPVCDKLIVVTAELRLSVSRIVLRDGISKVAAMRRLDAQLPEQTLRAAADFIIENNGSEAQLLRRANAILSLLETGDSTG